MWPPPIRQGHNCCGLLTKARAQKVPLGGPTVLTVKRPQLITSVAECILTCLQFHVAHAVLGPLEAEVCGVASRSLVPYGGPAVWGSGKGTLWSWCAGIMEGGGGLHILTLQVPALLAHGCQLRDCAVHARGGRLPPKDLSGATTTVWRLLSKAVMSFLSQGSKWGEGPGETGNSRTWTDVGPSNARVNLEAGRVG